MNKIDNIIIDNSIFNTNEIEYGVLCINDV